MIIFEQLYRLSLITVNNTPDQGTFQTKTTKSQLVHPFQTYDVTHNHAYTQMLSIQAH